ncbi:4Fe-4S dicluster domain-containing protein [Malonomonas rubra DSM 5091]|uniref:4Fe-4S dicluster domain-containing protein n=1 Tax=Malonomonas rubra DSM 5091 TaxID=1122189 RepID=A0A1M6ML88_MALRU|nr:4Fe-4S dicluster-binding protein [Malonomonas rubra]SHJ84043.1 4Fe-4S dicluster domain-containing protein [Malonomonas rubra DSM 5091]
MAHHTIKSSYAKLVERLNRFPQGAPPTELLFRILNILFSEKEAELVAQLPIKPFNAAKAAQIWKMNLTEARKVLDELASRAVLVDIEQNGESVYILPPPMAGFFEFSLMRTRGDIDQKLISELFYQYLNVEEDFIRDLFTQGETQLGRTFIHEPVLSNENAAHVLDYERATEVIKTASHIGVGMCYCRHKMEHLGKACKAEMDICMTFNASAESLTKHGHARAIDAVECLDLLQKAYEQNLVQFGENVRESVNFICNCCGCCCEAMIAARRFTNLNPVHTTNFIPQIKLENCNGCGKCVTTCPVEAIVLASANDPKHPQRKRANLVEDRCLGCGLCARVAPRNCIEMISRPQRVITPLNGTHRAVVMAVERGKLQHLIFDNQVLHSHRAMAALLGAVLRLPPIKRVMASQQMKSRYLEALIVKMEKEGKL